MRFWRRFADARGGWIAALALAAAPLARAEEPATLFIQEYRVEGAHRLARVAIEEAVYPFLGPGRTQDDVEQARAALEKAYRDAGYQTVTVQIPPQQVGDGIVHLQVVEGTVERLRVKGARYFSPGAIKAGAPSLAEGKLVDFNDVPHDIVALNQNPDRRVTPTLSAGRAPGSVDVDLNVTDSFPLHASVELNNRSSANTTSLRANASVTDNNLWQRGDSAGVSFQVAPQRSRDAKVFSGYYLSRALAAHDLTLMLQATKQDSDVSTLGGAAVTGRGRSVGARAILRLPDGKNFFQSVTLGADYKRFEQTLRLAGTTQLAPIAYYPLSAAYTATLVGERTLTEFDASVTLHVRGLGSGPAKFDARRYQADGSFIYFRADATQTRDLPHGWKLVAKAQGQAASQPLLDSEQFSGGGLGTARGYLESEVVGDNAIFGSLELHTPSLARFIGAKLDEWRLYAFADGGVLGIDEPLPQQAARFYLASYGFGTRLRFDERFNGSLDAGVPLVNQAHTKAHDLRLTFRLWADF
ncbi:MAG TPA: POTRA domain-containing protein [Opitutaceae bacterium]|nr:POTRA domain-containing protein [Opitutaceae bacterium]